MLLNILHLHTVHCQWRERKKSSKNSIFIGRFKGIRVSVTSTDRNHLTIVRLFASVVFICRVFLFLGIWFAHVVTISSSFKISIDAIRFSGIKIVYAYLQETHGISLILPLFQLRRLVSSRTRTQTGARVHSVTHGAPHGNDSGKKKMRNCK